MKQVNNLQLTAVFVHDPKSDRYTAFFANFPNIIAEGATEDDAILNLFETVQVVFNAQKNEELDTANEQNHVKTKTFNLAAIA
jgi:predicted RNase H-like HicB family nuclease